MFKCLILLIFSTRVPGSQVTSSSKPGRAGFFRSSGISRLPEVSPRAILFGRLHPWRPGCEGYRGVVQSGTWRHARMNLPANTTMGAVEEGSYEAPALIPLGNL